MLKFVILIIISTGLTICLAKPAAVDLGVSSPTTEAAIETSENIITDANTEFLNSYAAKMRSYMNQSVAPCDDFYEYACGNWKMVKPEKQSQHKRSNLLDIIYTLADITEELLISNSTLAKDMGYDKELAIAQQFYNACLNADLYPMPAADPAYLALIKSIGGFPAVEGEAWLASNFSWFNMSSHLTNYGSESLIRESIVPQYPFMPYFKLPELGFDYFVHSDNIATNDTKGYKLNDKRMRGYLKAYGLTDAKVDEVIAGVFAFWREALKVADRFDEEDYKCDALTVSENVEPFPKWAAYFDIAWKGDIFNDSSVDFCHFYYTELDKVCEKHKEAVANYLAMKLLYTLDSKLKSTKFQRDYCVLNIHFSMPYIFDKLYQAKYFTDDTNKDIVNIITELKINLKSLLNSTAWIDEETRTQALKKESTIESRIGSFKSDLSEKLIREINNLKFTPGTFAQNSINLAKFRTSLRRYNGIHHKVLPEDTKPLELVVGMQVNAFYYNIDNSINVMAGILHPPAYHKDWPYSLKYGTIGYLVGHELTHGFDSVGSQYDSEGQGNNWWSNKSEKVFLDRTQCYIDQYDKYYIPEINRHINGNQTKDENIADSGGLREALRAYRNFMKRQVAENKLPSSSSSEQMPGLDLSPEQLFFLGFAQVWCAAYEEEHYWEELDNDHTMDKYRVLGALTNIEDFAEAYSCPLGSPMNPKATKCRIW